MRYAWKRSYLISTFCSVFLISILEAPEMPRAIAGIPGLNLWNLLVLNNTFAWLSSRRQSTNSWDLPQNLKIQFSLYVGVMLCSIFRLLIDAEIMEMTFFSLISKYIFDTFKWFIPVFIIYDGCRSERDARTGLYLVNLTFVALAFFVIKSMGFRNLTDGDALQSMAVRVIARDTGYHRVDMSMILAGGTWSLYCLSQGIKGWKIQSTILALAALTALGQSMTGGRTGYATTIAIGCFFAVVKWRKLFILAPIAIAIILVVTPGAAERMFEGFGTKEGAIVKQADENAITSGRQNVWPMAIEKIAERPIIGWGSEGFVRAGLRERAFFELDQTWGHPHNAYLMFVLDNGFLGLFLCIPFGISIYLISYRLFMDNSNRLYEIAGGCALSSMLALAVASVGSQTFYPRTSLLIMWALIAIAIRVYIERRNFNSGIDTGFFSNNKIDPKAPTDEVNEPAK